ncbi:UDP-3-O-(3-hydroxymyristoyl)glucosamine N-acyltransferase [Planctomycetales bacterium ZRK34]|nr:UDP-3-O-(3-hydroxymyristoyl)glucosamine N-acyltransferase [Planctomycetales bacterium ZRK34]
MGLTTQQIADLTGGQLHGPGDVAIDSMEIVGRATAGQLTMIGSSLYAEQWGDSQATAALVAEGVELAEANGRAFIVVADVDLASAAVLKKLAPEPVAVAEGVHPSVTVDATARLGRGVRIAAGCYIGPNVVIGDNVTLHANVTIHAESQIGDSCVIWSGTVIRERCTLGPRCILHPNVTIGADGFGYRPAPGGAGIVKIPQIGTVQIGAEVEIGAGSCVDRGKFSATIIGDSCKIDNLVQIGHNCRLGRCVIIAGVAGIGGSVTIEDGAVIGAGVGIADHHTIGAGAKLAARAGVMHDIPAGQTWGGMPAQPFRAFMREASALRHLDKTLRWLRKKFPGELE